LTLLVSINGPSFGLFVIDWPTNEAENAEGIDEK
jgi:hypothetical protein